jgi:hypothetical protein
MAEVLQYFIPGACLLLILVGIRAARETLNPVFGGMMAGLANHAKDHATDYGKAFLFALSASLAAFYDIFSQVDVGTMRGMTWWQLIALWAKVLNPAVVAALAYTQKPTSK